MQYRIVKRKDSVLNEYRYYLHRRSHWWNNWVEVGYPCTTQKAASILLETYYYEEVVYFKTFGDYHGQV